MFYTTSNILAELKDSMSRLRIESMIASEVLKIKEVELQHINYIEEICLKIGNSNRLSSQDKSILALAKQEKTEKTEKVIVLLTDDFEIQNTAKTLGISFKPIKTRGISYTAKFKKYCQACGEILTKEDEFCPECGSTRIKTKKISNKIKKHQ